MSLFRTLLLIGVVAGSLEIVHNPSLLTSGLSNSWAMFGSGNRAVDAVIEDQTNQLAQMKARYRSWKEQQNCFADIDDYKRFSRENGMSYPVPPMCGRQETLSITPQAQKLSAEVDSAVSATTARLNSVEAGLRRQGTLIDSKLQSLSREMAKVKAAQHAPGAYQYARSTGGYCSCEDQEAAY